MNRVTDSDYLPFFFHRYESEVIAIDNHWSSSEHEVEVFREKYLHAYKSFLLEYYTFIRHAQYNFYDFIIGTALRFIMQGDVSFLLIFAFTS